MAGPRPKEASPSSSWGHRIPGWAVFAIPALVSFVLAAPCLRLTYVSDDFAFLQRAATFGWAQLLPDPSSAFYRPISRELYFAFLTLLDPGNPLWGHLINALLLAGSVALLAAFARRIGGAKLGLLSGLSLASLGALPCLVSWVSCSQDLFAMVFVGAALNLELSRRRALSIACMLAALLSKEAALFFVPALVSLRYVATGDRRDLARAALPYAAAALVWGAGHHKIREFLLHGIATGTGGYVGVDNPFMLRNALRTVGTLLNFPPTGFSTPWTPELTLFLAGGLLLLAVLFRTGPPSAIEGPHLLSDRTILWTGILLGVLPAILTVASAKHWFPYYSCIPAMGTSILAALALRRITWKTAILVLAAFMTLGVWYRGTTVGLRSVPAEANFRTVSDCLRRIDHDLRGLRPTFPDSARIYVNVQAPIEAGVHATLFQLRAPQTWYLNRTLVTMPAEYQDDTRWPKYLFWITPACEVFEISLPELRVRASKSRPSYADYQKTLRSYAMGAWATGDVDRAIAVLLNMQERDRLSWDFDRRLAGALLLASGREADAREALKGMPKPSRQKALDGVSAVLTPELPRPGLDDAAFSVFGLDTNDAEAARHLMFYFSDKVLLKKTKRMAERLLALRPGDEDAVAMLAALEEVPKWEAVLVNPEGWTPPFQEAY